MTEDELKALKKQVSKKKRIATELASAVHDLVEDSLWTDYNKLGELAEQTAAACREWDEANKKLEAESATA
ncbi:CCE_0567 family metalloprotein [Halioxenophilus sp. WMMB6]|uniref:CCE_0567 family metalloprotein n=1 Tax=Halioxenophilus sp. WMMB6 TaxID=3073815 RepID=UPI00295E6337|nr:CCE_0567 family metalloprotein [Halioxenophilus sp. WMMB6]